MFIPIEAGMSIAKPNKVGNNAQREAGRAQSLRRHPLDLLLSNLIEAIRTDNVVRNGLVAIDNPVGAGRPVGGAVAEGDVEN